MKNWHLQNVIATCLSRNNETLSLQNLLLPEFIEATYSVESSSNQHFSHNLICYAVMTWITYQDSKAAEILVLLTFYLRPNQSGEIMLIMLVPASLKYVETLHLIRCNFFYITFSIVLWQHCVCARVRFRHKNLIRVRKTSCSGLKYLVLMPRTRLRNVPMCH